MCSQLITAHAEGGKRWAQHGAGGDPGRRESRGRGLLNRKHVGQTPQKIKSKIGLVEYELGEEKTSKMQCGKIKLEGLEKHHLKHRH